jgi:uncharacterized protein YqeY
MTLEFLKEEMRKALKAGLKERKAAITAIIDEIQKAAITPKGRVEIDEELISKTLLKLVKMYEEMVSTCPADHKEKLEEYSGQLSVIKEYAPKILTDEEEILKLILSMEEFINDKDLLVKKNKGKVMKSVSAALKGKADMKVVAKVVDKILV